MSEVKVTPASATKVNDDTKECCGESGTLLYMGILLFPPLLDYRLYILYELVSRNKIIQPVPYYLAF